MEATRPAPSTTDAIPSGIVDALGAEGVAWILGLLRRVEATEERARTAEARVAELQAKNKLLRDENAALKKRLGKDSSNSHSPPNKDADNAKARKRRYKKRKPTGRPAGGQPGHKGHNRALQPIKDAREVFHHYPSQCPCGHDLSGLEDSSDPLAHQQFELPPIKLSFDHHVQHRRRCPSCKKESTATLPKQVRTGQGPRLTAFIGLLSGFYRLSRSHVVALMGDLFDLSLCKGTVQACVERTGKALEKPCQALTDALPDQDAVCLDETGWKQAGKKHWLWVATCALFSVFLISPSRGKAVVEKWFPNGFEGTAHSDRWSVYQYFAVERRQLCWSHLGRDLQAIIDGKGAGSERTTAMRAGEKAMFRAWWRFKNGELTRSQLQAQTQGFRDSFRAYCEAGKAQTADDDWRKLGKSMVKLWPAVFRFLDVEGVEPTNNAAERRLRAGVIHRRISQGTRSPTGSICLSRLMSAISTCRQRGLDTLDFLTQAVDAHWRGIPPPALLPDSG